MNYRIIFMGTPSFAANVLEGLILENFNIVAVVSQEDKKVGRKQVLTPSSVKLMANKYNLPIYTFHSIKDEYHKLLELKPDLIITCAYGQFIPFELIDYPKYKAINIHGSLLPKYRGGAPIQWSIINGETKTGISIINMTKKMDAGDILFTKQLEIDINDTNTSLFNKLSDLARLSILEFLPLYFENKYERISQNEDEATFAYNLTKKDEFISFNDNVLSVYNHIRGLLDNPGAFGMLKDRKYKFIKVGFEYDNNCMPSKYKGLIDNYLRIDCIDGYIKVFDIKPEGKNSMDAKSFYNGVGKDLVGELFNTSYEQE